MHEHLAVAPGLESMPARFEVGTNALEIVNLTVDGRDDASIFVRDGLPASVEVDDAEPRVAERDARTRIEPLSAIVRTAMVQAGDGSRESFAIDDASLRI